MLRFLKVQLEALTADFNNGLKAAQNEAKAFERTIKPTKQLLDDIGKSATAAGKTLTVALTAPIAAIAGVGLAFNAMQEQAQIAFTTMLGDGQKAKIFLDDLKDFAARTPFEFPGLVKAAQRLMAMGFEAKAVKPLLEAVGNAVAGLGGGSAEIDRVTLALGQMAGRGKVATQEMNQLTEIGIPAWKALADGFGVAESKIREFVEKGLVPADQAIQILTEDMNERFGGMLDKQAESFSGLVSTIKDEARFLAGDLTESLFAALKAPAMAAVDALHSLRDAMRGWSDQTKATVVVIAGLAAALGPALFIVGQLASSFTSVITAVRAASTAFSALNLAMAGMFIGPAGLAVAGTVVLVGLAAAFLKYRDATKEARESIAAMTATMNDNRTAAEKLAEMSDKYEKSGKKLLINTDQLNAAMKQSREEAEKLARSQMTAEVSAKGLSSGLEGVSVNLKEGTIGYETAAKGAAKFNLEIGKTPAEIKAAAEAQARLVKQLAEMRDELDKNQLAFERAGALDIWKSQQDQMEEYERGLRRFNQAVLDMVRSQKALREELADSIVDLNKRVQDELDAQTRRTNEETIDGILKASDERKKAIEKEKQAQERAAQDIKRSAGAVFDAMFLKGESVFKSLGNALKGGALSLGRAIFEDITAALLGPVKKAFDDFIGGILGKITGSLGNKLAGALGIGGTAASSATGAIGTAGSAAGSIGGVGSSAAGGAGSLTAGLIGAAGGIIGGGLSALATLRTEGTLNAIEFNTRATRIHAEVMINDLLHPIRNYTQFTAEQQAVHATQLDAIFNALTGRTASSTNVYQTGRVFAEQAAAAGSVPAPVVVNATFAPVFNLPPSTDRDAIVATVVDSLDINYRNFLGDVVQLIRGAAPGVVAGVA